MEKVISKDGTLIAFDRSGSGPSLVLVDGAFCFREYGTTPKIVPLLKENFTVYSYDRRGRGESTDTLPYSIEKEIDDLERVIEKTGEEPFICGFSSGAGLVLQAVASGVKAKKIALFEPPYFVELPPGFPRNGEAVTMLNGLVTNGKRSEAVKYFMKKIIGMPSFAVSLFKLFGNSMWRMNERVANTLPYDIEIMGNYFVPENIASEVNIPALVISGENSPVSLRKSADGLAELMPLGKKSRLRGQSHNVNMKVLSPVLHDFFRS